MRFPLPLSGSTLAARKEGIGASIAGYKARLLAAGASILALGAVQPAEAVAANVPGVLQHNEDNIAINLFEVEEGVTVESGATETASNPGGHAVAEAIVNCAEADTCPNPGQVVQYAHGTDSAANSASIGGSLSIGAEAVAEGASATGAGVIQIGLWQVTAADESAQNDLDVSGSFDIGASGHAVASEGSAVAFAGVGAGVSQIASSIGVFGSAGNSLGNSGSLTIGADADAAALLGDAAATAFLGVGVYQKAIGQEAASLDVANSGTILIDASASADADQGIAVATAFAAGIVQLGQAYTHQFQSGFTSNGALVGETSNTPSGPASVELANSGTLEVLSSADADGGSDAAATAAVTGMVQIVAGSTATAELDNSGIMTIAASADSEAAGSPRAVVFVAGITQSATAIGSSTAETIQPTGTLTYQLSSTLVGPAHVSLSNSGTIAIGGTVDVLAEGAGTTDEGAAVAFVGGIDQQAIGDGAEALLDNSGSISIIADVSVDSANIASGVSLASGIDQSATAYAGTLTAVFASGTTSPTYITGNSYAAGPASATLSNSGSITVAALLQSHGDQTAYAGATASAIGQYAAGTQATVELSNSGTLTSIGSISSSGHRAYGAAAGIGFQQGAGGTAAAISFNNGGAFNVLAAAAAEGVTGAFVNATAFGGAQIATAIDQATVNIANSGSIEIGAVASAIAGDTSTFDMAMAFADAHGIGQKAEGAGAAVGFENSGNIELIAHADAVSEDFAMASASAVGAVNQFAIGTEAGSASAGFINNESLLVGASANATASSIGIALAGFEGAINQAAIGGTQASASITNADQINLVATAEVNGAEGAATDSVGAYAFATGILQLANAQVTEFGTATVYSAPATQTFSPSGPASVALANSGSIDLGLQAHAAADGIALAAATGDLIFQAVTGTESLASLANSGQLDVAGQAVAQADGTATAVGYVRAVVQSAAGIEAVLQLHATSWSGVTSSITTELAGFASAQLTNSGSIEVGGLAQAQAVNGLAKAEMEAHGVVQKLLGLGAPEASFENGGDIAVVARAEATGDSDASADALAGGYQLTGNNAQIEVSNGGKLAVLAEASAGAANASAVAQAIGIAASAADGFVNGSIANGGNLVVAAEAEVAGNGSAIALATGIGVTGSSSDVTLSNSGAINVSAASSGGLAEATAIKFTASGAGPGDGAIIITNNAGTIVARHSLDGGQSWRRGTAIDVSAAPNPVTLNLVGSGSIYGNIDVASGATINVAGGETWFDGIINAECQLGGCGQGVLNVGDGGALFFRHRSAGGDGPSAAYLEQLNVASDGTLIFELPAGDDPETAYPTIVTDVANLDGTLLVRSESGLYGDSYSFDNVIDAEVRNGQFDLCGIDGNPALLELSCSYDGDGNVDLAIDRIAFNAVDGLTRNQRAVGSGIEAVYDVELTGPFAEMVGELFSFGDDDYRVALDQLSGASHAAYLQSFNSLGEAQTFLIHRAIGCELPTSVASSLSCRPGKLNLWGQLDYANRQSDGDQEALGYDSDRWTAAIGGDVEVGPDIIAGASLAKLSNRLDFHDGSRWNADGIQLGAYGAIDPGHFYAKVIGTLAWFDGDSDRTIDWTDFGGALAGTLKGDVDARLWTLAAHFGYRVPLGDRALLTPFLNVDHSSARLDGFTEIGLAGANLTIDDSTSSRTAVTVGAKWAADLGGVVPQAELGYRHLFGNRRASVDAAFADQAGSDFELVSAAEKRGSLLAGISLGGKAGPVDVRVGYQGLYGGSSKSHSASFRVILPFGGN